MSECVFWVTLYSNLPNRSVFLFQDWFGKQTHPFVAIDCDRVRRMSNFVQNNVYANTDGFIS